MTFKPGQSGNPKGREKGVPDCRGKLRKLLEPHAPEVIEVLVKKALKGNPHAMRLFIERLIPRARDEPIGLALPPDITKGESLITIAADIVRRLAAEEITPEEAKSLLEVMSMYRDNFIVQEICKNLNSLAERVNKPSV